MTKAEEIVKGLTEAQRDLLDQFDCDDDVVFIGSSEQFDAAHTLYEMCVVAKVLAGHLFVTLEPLGCEVRALLKGQDHG